MVEVSTENEVIYSCYPGQRVDKTTLYAWCEDNFGPMHDSYDHTNWTLTSHYDERPSPLNPFKFATVRQDFYTLFALRWL
jgi:hypothetical protein